MKYLIVNGDDFGASRGINRGILEAHRRGILTSASLLVKMPSSEEAAALIGAAPDLSVGLHVDLPNSGAAGPKTHQAALEEQLFLFKRLMGCLPTHLDSHRNVHRDPGLLPCFSAFARAYDIPLREHSPIHHLSKFYGQWSGETHLEQIGAESLKRMLESDIGDGITELMCHPGYPDPDYTSSYSVEREVELQTLCDPRIRQTLARAGIQLISYHDVTTVLGSTAG